MKKQKHLDALDLQSLWCCIVCGELQPFVVMWLWLKVYEVVVGWL